jgi:myo-inositol-1(or 4)-monophosphatase
VSTGTAAADPLEVAVATAREAGELLLSRVGLPLETSEKSARGDLVTASDRASEALIVARLHGAFPRSAILGEEGGATAGTSDERWIVDPLDGTTNYAHGYPLYCVSIAYERAGEVRAAAIYAPALGELYAAELGSGATCNGARIAVTGVERVAESLVCTGFVPARYERNGANFARLSGLAQAVRRDGSAALDLAFVAAGRFEAFWEFDLKAWDVAAGALIVREAGGSATAIDGTPLALDGGSILASNGRVHADMVAALTPAHPQ